MHASVEQLLNLRDAGVEAAEVASHVAGCESCQSELGRLRAIQAGLQSLKEFQAPERCWETIRSTNSMPAIRRRPVITGWLWVGSVAAGLAVAVVLFGLINRVQRGPGLAGKPVAVDATPTLVSGSGRSAVAAESTEAMDLPTLMARSRQLEWALRAMPEGPQVVSADTAGTISVLEDRITMIDYRLSMNPDTRLPEAQQRKLWRERVDLMEGLVQVRYAQAQNVSF